MTIDIRYVDLGVLIKFLRTLPEDKIIKHGFGKPRSYRGYYEELAFEPEENVTAGSMLCHATSALGEKFEGYKGGEYTMQVYTDCYIAEYGESGGDKIGPALLNYWAE